MSSRIPFGRSSRCLSWVLVGAALLAWGAPALRAGQAAGATDSAQVAVKALLAAQDQALSAFKKATDTEADAVRTLIKGTEQGLAFGADGPAAVGDLFDELSAFQALMQTHIEDACKAQADAAKEALAALAPATEGQYPAAFYPGDGTPTDKFERGIDEYAAKTYSKLHERLEKTVKKFEAKGVHVALRLDPPRRHRFEWNSQTTDFYVIPAASIDLVVASSVEGIAGDGKLRVAGAAGVANPFFTSVSIDAVQLAPNTKQQTVVPANNRYIADFQGASFDEGTWLIGVSYPGTVPADETIGIR